jgi:hypothetical protein
VLAPPEQLPEITIITAEPNARRRPVSLITLYLGQHQPTHLRWLRLQPEAFFQRSVRRRAGC